MWAMEAMGFFYSMYMPCAALVLLTKTPQMAGARAYLNLKPSNWLGVRDVLGRIPSGA